MTKFKVTIRKAGGIKFYITVVTHTLADLYEIIFNLYGENVTYSWKI